MKVSLPEATTKDVFAKLAQANSAFNQFYPGESSARQPVHTVYGGAQLFKADSAKKLGTMAVASLQEYAADASILAKALDLPGKDTGLASKIYDRVQEKLNREAVEDFRIDFEDGYGNRPDSEEDHHAEADRPAQDRQPEPVLDGLVKHGAVVERFGRIIRPSVAMGVKMQEAQRFAVFFGMRLQQRIGDEMVAAEGEHFGMAVLNDVQRVLLDGFAYGPR